MSKQQQQNDTPNGSADTTRLKVWAEHRDPVDWDKYIAVLIAMALAELEEERKGRERD